MHEISRESGAWYMNFREYWNEPELFKSFE